MKNVILVFERPDISAASVLQASIPDSEVWVFDPHLLDDLVAAGLQHSRYVKCELNIDMPESVKGARESTLSIEKALETHLRKIDPEAEIAHWQHLNWHFLHATLDSYARLWDVFLKTNVEGIHFHVLVRDIPATFGLPSFLPAIMLLERLTIANGNYSAYSHSAVDAPQRLVPFRTDLLGGNNQYDAFVHLPTTLYDSRYFESEIAATGLKVLNFDSQEWYVPYAAFENAGLAVDSEILNKFLVESVALVEGLAKKIADHLTNYLQAYIKTLDYARRQAIHIANLYRAQMIFYLYLDKCFSYKPPAKLIIANHDAGFNGPFLSFSKKHRVQILMLPHAKVFNWPIPCANSDIVALTHPIQGGSVSTLSGKTVLTRTVNFPEVLFRLHQEIEPISRIGLILNKFSSDGMTTVDSGLYLSGMRKLIDWCRDHSIELRIRVKPHGTCVQWLTRELDLSIEDLSHWSEGSMAHFGQDCNVCLMYDAPTSGAIDLLRTAIPVLSTVFRPLAMEESKIVCAELVPRTSIDETLIVLESFVLDPVNLAKFRSIQFGKYASKASQAAPLRSLI